MPDPGTTTPAAPASPALAPAPTENAPGRLYERFNVHQRIQHAILAFSFTGLIVTGWPLKFPEVGFSRLFATVLGGPGSVGICHRTLAVLLILASLYHVGYLAYMFLRGQRSLEIMPGFTDAKEALGDITYFFGLRKERPRFGRYNWIEKFEYFAVAWGTLVMVITGLIIWAPTYAALHLPNWAINASVIIHDYEAILAGLAIFLWHFYWVHLHPDVYPMSTVWLHGLLSEQDMAHHHPRELERLQRRAQAKGGAAGPEQPAPAAAEAPSEEDSAT
jgi:cytochrome b subunit of formate dehydrogenase